MLECCEFLQDVWHCPKTNGTQHILHSSSHIVDTTTRQGDSLAISIQLSGLVIFRSRPPRQSIARWYNKSFLVSGILQQKRFVESENPQGCPALNPEAIWTTCGYPWSFVNTTTRRNSTSSTFGAFFPLQFGRSWSLIYFTGSCYTWNAWSHSCVKHALILLGKHQEVEFLQQCWVPMGDLTQILPGETGKTPIFFCIDFRRRWWCYYPPWWYFTDPQVEMCWSPLM